MSLFIFSISSWFGLEGFPGGAVGKNKTTTTKNLPANADVRDVGSIPGSGKFLGVGNGNPFLAQECKRFLCIHFVFCNFTKFID